MKTYLKASLIVTLLFTSALLFPIPIAHATDPVLLVEPDEFHFFSDVDPVGTTFEVSVIIANITAPPFYGWEFVLSWTPGVINCTGQTLNLNIWDGFYLGPWIPVPIDNVAGTYHQSLTGSAPGTPKSGTFWLANLTFVIAEEAPYMDVLSTNLTLAPNPPSTYCIADITATAIPHGFMDGAYYYHWTEPTTKMYLQADPSIYTATSVGEEFDIDILIKDVVAGWRLGGVQFILMYNTTILDALSVTVGDFFEPFFSVIAPPQTFKWFGIYESVGMVRVAYTVLDVPHYIPPYGDGKIATIHFNATLQGEFPDLYSCDLDIQIDTEMLVTSYFANVFGIELGTEAYKEAEDGYYEIIPVVLGRAIDVYTQYPEPHGGQGPMRPSDMFWPQKLVWLFANVSYNEWPEQNKDVAFQVIDPHDDTYTILYARTNSEGVANASFRLPWMCDNPEYYIGEWTIIATVDIACIIVNDTLTFKYDYMARLFKVTTDKGEYAHCENINVTVVIQSYMMQDRNVTIFVTVLDETGVPFGYIAVALEIGSAVYCEYKNYTIEVSLHVKKWARAGTAEVIAGVLDDFPFLGGTIQSQPYDPTEIRILAEWA